MSCMKPLQEKQAVKDKKICLVIYNITVDEAGELTKFLNEYRERKK